MVTPGFSSWRRDKEQLMKARGYLILCAVIAVAWAVILLSVPTVSDTVEQLMIGFLSTYAR